MTNRSQFLKSVNFLSVLSDQQRDAVGSLLKQESYNQGDIIVKQGEKADALYVIKKGKVSAFGTADDSSGGYGKEIAKMREGGVFGESALTENAQTRKYTVRAMEDGVEMFILGDCSLFSEVFCCNGNAFLCERVVVCVCVCVCTHIYICP